MSDAFLDRLPSREREKIRKRLRSPEEYERLRERVKGPEDLEHELRRQDRMADIAFRLETEPGFQERAKTAVERLIAEHGPEELFDADLSPDARRALERGRFTVTVAVHPESHVEQLAAVPEGSVHETLPVTLILSDQCAAALTQTTTGGGDAGTITGHR